MKITETRLKTIITEEVEKIVSEEAFPTSEELLKALSIISEASSTALKENLHILEELLLRAKNT